VADTAADDGEAPVIVGVSDAAMHMFTSAIESLPAPNEPEFSGRAAVILTGLRKLEAALAQAARRNRATPTVVVALSSVRNQYHDLMERAAAGPGSTLGQQLYVARKGANLTTKETANGAGLRADLIEAIEAEEDATEDEKTRIKALISAIGG
jgi:hypothetical protein